MLDEQRFGRSLTVDEGVFALDPRRAARDRVAWLVVALARAMARQRLILTDR